MSKKIRSYTYPSKNTGFEVKESIIEKKDGALHGRVMLRFFVYEERGSRGHYFSMLPDEAMRLALAVEAAVQNKAGVRQPLEPHEHNGYYKALVIHAYKKMVRKDKEKPPVEVTQYALLYNRWPKGQKPTKDNTFTVNCPLDKYKMLHFANLLKALSTTQAFIIPPERKNSGADHQRRRFEASEGKSSGRRETPPEAPPPAPEPEPVPAGTMGEEFYCGDAF